MPTLSIILPAYNAQDFLREAINSVLEQTYRDFELIVIDDGSKDATPELLEQIDDRRLRVIRHEENRGLIAGLNEGLEVARGRFIGRMDADDICDPERFSRQIQYLDAHPAVGVLGTGIQLIDEFGRSGACYVMPPKAAEVYWAMPLLCPLAHPTVVMRAEVAQKLGGYSGAAIHAEDYELWQRAAHLTLLENLPEPLLRLRKHSSSVTAVLSEKHLDAASRVAKVVIDERLGDNIPLPVVSCLRFAGRIDRRIAADAAEVLLRLKAHFESRIDGQCMGVGSMVGHDVGIRLARLALHASGWRTRSRILQKAFESCPELLQVGLKKILSRSNLRAKRVLVG